MATDIRDHAPPPTANGVEHLHNGTTAGVPPRLAGQDSLGDLFNKPDRPKDGPSTSSGVGDVLVAPKAGTRSPAAHLNTSAADSFTVLSDANPRGTPTDADTDTDSKSQISEQSANEVRDGEPHAESAPHDDDALLNDDSHPDLDHALLSPLSPRTDAGGVAGGSVGGATPAAGTVDESSPAGTQTSTSTVTAIAMEHTVTSPSVAAPHEALTPIVPGAAAAGVASPSAAAAPAGLEGPDKLSELPEEALLLILMLLDYVSLCRLAQCNRRLRNAVEDSNVWKRLIKLRWLSWAPKKGEFRSSKEAFRSRHKAVNAIWKAGTPTFECLWGHTGKITCVAVNENFVISGSMDKTVRIWDLNQNKECVRILDGHTGFVSAVRTEGRFLVSGSADRSVKQWDFETGQCVQNELLSTQIYDLQAARGQRVVVACHDGAVRLLDLRTANVETGRLEGHQKAVFCVVWDGDATVISGGVDKTCRVWDLRRMTCSQKMEKHKKAVTSIYWEPGNNAVSASVDKTARAWDISTGVVGKKFIEGHTETITSVGVQGNFLVTGSNDRTLRVWNLRKGKQLYALAGKSGDVCAMTCTRDMIVCGSVRTVNIWDFTNESKEE